MWEFKWLADTVGCDGRVEFGLVLCNTSVYEHDKGWTCKDSCPFFIGHACYFPHSSCYPFGGAQGL